LLGGVVTGLGSAVGLEVLLWLAAAEWEREPQVPEAGENLTEQERGSARRLSEPIHGRWTTYENATKFPTRGDRVEQLLYSKATHTSPITFEPKPFLIAI